MTYNCLLCDYMFDEEKGDPDSGIAPGTKWEDVPTIGCVLNVAQASKILSEQCVTANLIEGEIFRLII